MKKLSEIFVGIFYSFPIQLVLLSLKKHFLLLFFWILLFGYAVEWIGAKYGISNLFFNPEYLGEINFISFLLLGVAFGGFFITWNITSYILNAYRFPFLATLKRPFVKYTLNNFIIPGIFFVVYIVCLYRFQREVELISVSEVITRILGFLAGIVGITFASFAYFFSTNANLSKILGLGKDFDPELEYKKVDSDQDMSFQKAMLLERGWRVDTYLSNVFKARPVRSTEHYDGKLLKRVFFQNHVNALIVESIAFLLLVALGYLTEIHIFRIPAAASALLLFSIMIMFIGALGFWLRGWRTFTFIALLIAMNYFLMTKVFNFQHQAFGIDYNKGVATYNYDKLTDFTSRVNTFKDRNETLKILEAWKAKFPKGEKPKMVFLNVSGGGLRSAVWTMNVLQKLNKETNGDFFRQTMLISGASGGMIGAAYYRELFLRYLNGEIEDPNDRKYAEKMSKDLLNALALSIATNDFFNPFQKVQVDGKEYSKDRGYAFEKQLHENTDYIMDKTVADYRNDEAKSNIPMLFVTPVIMGDGKSMIISPQNVSYMCKSAQKETNLIRAEVEGVEFLKLFADQSGEDLRFSTALRMSASFPYVTPNISLPSDPILELTDAGMKDNFGTSFSLKFLHNFKYWIAKNTSGVVIIQIRDTEKKFLDEYSKPSPIGRIFYPIGNFFSNWQKFQDTNRDNEIGMALSWFEGDLDVIRFEYSALENQRKASLSWHLTKLEQQNIQQSIDLEVNEIAFKNLMRLLGENKMEVY